MKTNAKFIGIDAGTTSCKGVLIAENGSVLRYASSSYSLQYPSGMIEQDAADMWQAAKKVIQSLLEDIERPEEVKSLAVTSQGITFLPIDKKGKPLRRAISWLDNRAVEETERITQIFSEEELFALTGKRIQSCYVLPKLLWLKNKEPEIFERADKFLMVMDFLVKKLTGVSITDHTLAAGTLLYDVRKNRWSKKIINKFLLSPEVLPAIKWVGSVAGYLTKKAADETGLKQGTSVVLAGQDQKCATFGTGLKEGVATVSLGTASAITSLTHKPVIDAKRRIPLFPYLFPGQWVLEGVVSTASAAFDWIRKITSKSSRVFRSSALSPEKLHSLPFFIPYLSGASSPLWMKDARGSFHHLTLATTSEDLILSVLEGVSFEIRRNIEILEELTIPLHEVIVFGGGVRNTIWRFILTNVVSKELSFLDFGEASAFGAALLAGISAGIFDRNRLPHLKKNTMQPDNGWVKMFHKRYKTYLVLSERFYKDKSKKE